MSNVLSNTKASQHETPIGHRLREHTVGKSSPSKYVAGAEFYPDQSLIAGLNAEKSKATIQQANMRKVLGRNDWDSDIDALAEDASDIWDEIDSIVADLLAAKEELIRIHDEIDADVVLLIAYIDAYIAAISAASAYSTSETATLSTWIDGKTIYRKVVFLSGLPAAGSANYAHGITGLSNFVNIRGFGYGGGLWFPLPHPTAGATQDLQVTVDATNIIIAVGTSYGAYNGYMILEYTKT